MRKERVFVGSSTKAIGAARDLMAVLDASGLDLDMVLWTDTVWKNLETALTSLESGINEYDYAVFLAYPDDKASMRGTDCYVTRDNVIFEFGLFLSRLGNLRTFLVRPSNSEMQILSDIGSSPTAAIYSYVWNSTGTDILPIDFTNAASHITKSINESRKRDAAGTPASEKSGLRREVAALVSEVDARKDEAASVFNVASSVKAHIFPLIKHKAHLSGRDIYDVAHDMGKSFALDDLVDLGQLAQQQRFDATSNPKLQKVKVFAETPIELIGSAQPELQRHINQLRKTVAYNILNGIEYTYFTTSKFPIDDLSEFLKEFSIDSKMSKKMIEIIRLPRSFFKTYFTIHSFVGRHDVYMSLITENRNDLLIKLEQSHGRNVFNILDTLQGKVQSNEKFRFRDFVVSDN